MTTDLFLK